MYVYIHEEDEESILGLRRRFNIGGVSGVDAYVFIPQMGKVYYFVASVGVLLITRGAVCF